MAAPDARQRREQFGVLIVDRRGDFGDRPHNRPQRLADADLLHLAEQLKKLPLHLGEKADEPRDQVTAGGIAFEVFQRVQSHRLREPLLQAATDNLGDKHFVHIRAHGQFDPVKLHPLDNTFDSTNHGPGLAEGSWGAADRAGRTRR